MDSSFLMYSAVKILKPDPPSYFSLSSTLWEFGNSCKREKRCKIELNKVQNCQLQTSRSYIKSFTLELLADFFTKFVVYEFCD